MISVVIPAYNRCESLLQLLGDLERQRGIQFEVIVVDDNSSDGTPAAVAEQFPSTIVLRNDVNRGPAVTRNRGVRQARGNLIVGFDSDVRVPADNFLANVAQRFRALPQVSGFAFRILLPDDVTDDVGRWWHPVSIKTHADRAFFTSYFSGTAYALRKDAMLRAGLYPEDIFMHYEEVELAFRVLDDGGSIMYLPEFTVHHHENRVSRRTEVDKFYRPRNQVLLAVSCLPWPRAVGYIAPRLAFQFYKAVRYGYVRSYGRALASAAHLLPGRLKVRRPLKKDTLQRINLLRAGVPAS